MSLGVAPRQTALLGSTAALCEGRVAADSIYGLLHRECDRLFADELFADLFCDGRGRRSVPPMIVAVVMVLQRIEGCSDREAVDRFTYDARWKYACGGLDFAYPGFVHTVLERPADAGEVFGHAHVDVGGPADVVVRVTVGGLEVQHVDSAGLALMVVRVRVHAPVGAGPSRALSPSLPGGPARG
jgi:hypothetical protein